MTVTYGINTLKAIFNFRTIKLEFWKMYPPGSMSHFGTVYLHISFLCSITLFYCYKKIDAIIPSELHVSDKYYIVTMRAYVCI